MSKVSNDLVRRAAKAYVDAIVPADRSHISGWWPDHQHTIRAALEAVADDLRAEGRRATEGMSIEGTPCEFCGELLRRDREFYLTPAGLFCADCGPHHD